jgi:hypothetical protein
VIKVGEDCESGPQCGDQGECLLHRLMRWVWQITKGRDDQRVQAEQPLA